MDKYGVTKEGFVLKRADEILDEIHSDLSEGFGFDTKQNENSFIDVLATTFAGVVAELWEVAQDTYYSLFPVTAEGLSLDYAAQTGGVTREPARRSMYPLHVTGVDGTVIDKTFKVGTKTLPKLFLEPVKNFELSRDNCNSIKISVSAEENSIYTVSINGKNYEHTNENGNVPNILSGLSNLIKADDYVTSLEGEVLTIADKMNYKNNTIDVSSNLSVISVTTIQQFQTEEYGKKLISNGVITEIVNNVDGLMAVTNILEPTLGRREETDSEFRQSYRRKAGLKSNTMIDSICSYLKNNVKNVETAYGYENVEDTTDSNGIPPHSIEILVDGGEDTEVANAILKRKAGGINTHGSVEVQINTNYGDIVNIRFNRPQYLYSFLKVVIHGDRNKIATDYVEIVKKSIIEDLEIMDTSSLLLIQTLEGGIYRSLSGVSYLEIFSASSTEKSYSPSQEDYKKQNITATLRQKMLFDKARIEVVLDEHS